MHLCPALNLFILTKIQCCIVATLKQPLVEMRGKAVYIRPKVVRPFPEPCASWSYVHRAALFLLHLFSQDIHNNSLGTVKLLLFLLNLSLMLEANKLGWAVLSCVPGLGLCGWAGTWKKYFDCSEILTFIRTCL
jgi:hypothetical protein